MDNHCVHNSVTAEAVTIAIVSYAALLTEKLNLLNK